jgi:SH3 domain-containing YSC84-like protein 1
MPGSRYLHIGDRGLNVEATTSGVMLGLLRSDGIERDAGSRPRKRVCRLIVCFAALSLVYGVMVCTGGIANAASFQDVDARVARCNLVVEQVLAMPDGGIPKDLLQRSRGVVIFPGVLKAGVVVGISYGSGVMLRRDEGTAQWSKLAFVKIKGGSLGVQVGAQYTDLILLLMSEDAVEALLEDGLTLGVDISIAAGPVGRDASAGTDRGFSAGILSYSRSKGLFLGLSLKGAVMGPDRESNNAYHGKGITVQDVLYGNEGTLSDSGKLLIATLDEASK